MSIRLRLALAYALLLLATCGLMLWVVYTAIDYANSIYVDELVRLTVLVLVGIAILAAVASWIVAGLLLRPLRRLHAAVQNVDATSLGTRIALRGPHDEIRALADMLDVTLARLDDAFESRRLFAANAAHELRTPLTTMRVTLQVAARTETDADRLAVLHRLSRTVAQMTSTIDALVELTANERVQDAVPVDVAALVDDALRAQAPDILGRRIRVERDPRAFTVRGSPELLRRLVDNLVRNAVVHNLDADGAIRVDIDTTDPARPALVFSNSGAVLDDETVGLLTQPFYRARLRTGGGHGLGLAIAASIARAHDIELLLAPRAGGGLAATLRVPAADVSPHRSLAGATGEATGLRDRRGDRPDRRGDGLTGA